MSAAGLRRRARRGGGAWSTIARGIALAITLGFAPACGPGDAPTRASAPDPAGAEGAPTTLTSTTSPTTSPTPTVRDACRGPGIVGDAEIEAIPDDARLAAAIDLRDPAIDAALEHLEAWARSEDARVPVVLGLTLSNIGFQTRWTRDLLRDRGFDLEAALLLIAPGGESIWLWRIACDLGPLKQALAAEGTLRIRALASGGVVAEPVDPAAFPFDLVVAAGDRIALVPAGKGVDLLRWLGRKSAVSGDADARVAPSARLAAVEPAALRVVIADRSEHGVVVTPSGESPSAVLRVTGASVERLDPPHAP